MPMGNRMLTTGEAAELCGVSRSTLRRAVAQGQVQAWHTPGRHLRFSIPDCLAFAQSLGRPDIELIGRRYIPADGDGADRVEERVLPQPAGGVTPSLRP